MKNKKPSLWKPSKKRKDVPYMDVSRDNDQKRIESPYMEKLRNIDQKTNRSLCKEMSLDNE